MISEHRYVDFFFNFTRDSSAKVHVHTRYDIDGIDVEWCTI